MVDDVGERFVEILCREFFFFGFFEFDNEFVFNEFDIVGYVKRGMFMGSGGYEGQESEKSFGMYGEEKKVKLKVRFVLIEGVDFGLVVVVVVVGGEEYQNYRKWYLFFGYIFIWIRDFMIF